VIWFTPESGFYRENILAEWVPILDVIEPAQPASPQPFTPEVKVYAEAKLSQRHQPGKSTSSGIYGDEVVEQCDKKQKQKN
jgi:hypothetical protein